VYSSFLLFTFAWHFFMQVLPNLSVCTFYLFIFNNCNYALLLLKCCPSLLDNIGIRVCPRNFRNSSLFTATYKISQSSRCVSAASLVCKDPISLENSLLYQNKFCAHLWHFLISLSRFFRVQVFVPVFDLHCYFPPAIILFLLCMFCVVFSVFDGLG
jgi:hypothetical protein